MTPHTIKSQSEFDALLARESGALDIALKGVGVVALRTQRTVRLRSAGFVEAWAKGAVAEAWADGATASAWEEGVVALALADGAFAGAHVEGAVALALADGAVASAWEEGAVALALADGAVAVECGKPWQGPIPKGTPAIKDLDGKLLLAIKAGATLEMGDWHNKACATTHCRAGHYIAIAGKKGKALEAKFGPFVAGAAIFAASYPGDPIPDFFASNEAAMADITRRVAEDEKEQARRVDH